MFSATRAPEPIAGTVKDGPDADGLILVGWSADAAVDAGAENGYERVRWVSGGGHIPAVDDDALLLLSASGDPWALVSAPAGQAFVPKAASVAARNEMFVDSADLALKFKDNGGTVHALY
jgi:hypothetical protein